MPYQIADAPPHQIVRALAALRIFAEQDNERLATAQDTARTPRRVRRAASAVAKLESRTRH